MSSDCPKVTPFISSGTELGVLYLPTPESSIPWSDLREKLLRDSRMPNSGLWDSHDAFSRWKVPLPGSSPVPRNIRPGFLFVLFRLSQDGGHTQSVVGLPISKGKWEQGSHGFRDEKPSCPMSAWVGSETLKAHFLLIHLFYFSINSVTFFQQ